MYDKSSVHGEVNKHLIDLAKQLAAFLEDVLPFLSNDWWDTAVVNCLSLQQKRRLQQDNICTLGGLDLAGLLRVLDNNWYQISQKLSLSHEDRHFAKEMITVRNHWAHVDADGLPIDDIYRDLDTIQRFAIVINADNKLIENLQKTKKELLATEYQSVSSDRAENTSSAPKKEEAEFKPGQIVFIKSNPTSRGAVVSVQSNKPENRYTVFIDGITQVFYASQLQAEEQLVEENEPVSSDLFHAYLSALQIKYPGLGTLYSLNAARVDFIPYQFRPVLRFISSDRPRLLIADGVGVGKTIEAGLILRELQARRDISSVLIICPRPLVTEKKWLNEMKRFEERFIHLDGPNLRDCIDEMDKEGVWPERHRKVIVPYSLFDEMLLHGSASGDRRRGNRKKGLLDLDPPPRFDLVIVDEAHHVRNQNTFRHKAVKFFCDHAEAVLFLTATPIQLGNHDLFVLLNMLRPDIIIDQESFTHLAEPNPFINQAVSAMRTQTSNWQNLAMDALGKAASTPWGRAILKHNPDFTQACTQLSKSDITPKERIKMITDTEGLHTFARIINRTRRRDIGNFTIRKPKMVNVPFTPAQQRLHDELLRIQAEIFSELHNSVNVKFMMTTIRRQAASCLFGLAPFLEGILNRHLDELDWDDLDDSSAPDEAAIIPFQGQIQALLELARTLDKNDPKLEALFKIISNKQNLPNNKIMLFSSFRHTLSYLFEHLKKADLRVGMVHGGTPDEERVSLRARFEKPREDKDCLDLLLFSEIGCEGLDYQFCDCIVNYDLPWNPMRVEQRIGRIDRNGQKSESVAIVNLITPGTVDADIYERCLVRIGVFENSIGDCEEILGEVTRGIKDIAEDYQLSEEERREKLQQLSDNKIRLINEQEQLEQKQAELFGIHLPQEQISQEINDASNFWLSPFSLRKMVTFYLQRLYGKEQEFFQGEKPLKTLRAAQELRNRLLKDFQQLPRQSTPIYRDWENWLKDSNPHLSITFESDCAMQHPEAAFIMPLHPLVKQAAESFGTKQRIFVNLKAVHDKIPAGHYKFAIYRWCFHGVREDLQLKPVAMNTALNDHLSELLKTAIDCIEPVPDGFDEKAWDKLDTMHYEFWKNEKNSHQRKTKEQVRFRRESLSTSHKARIELLKEQLNQASNEKILRMRQSQIDAAEADYARRVQELDIAEERADIVADPVAYGMIQIIKGSSDGD